MATVVNTFPDRRGALIGSGLGVLAGNVLAARKKKREEEEKQKKLERALQIMGAMSGQGGQSSSSGGTQQQAPQPQPRQRQGIEVKNLGSPTPTGKDVASLLLAAGVDQKFSITLAQSLDDAKVTRENKASEEAAFTMALDTAIKQGATREDMLSAITNAEINPDLKLRAMAAMSGLYPKDEDFNIKLFNENGEINVSVPEAVAKDERLRTDFVAKHFPSFSAVPVEGIESGPGGLKGKALSDLVARGVMSQDTADKIAGGTLVARGPDGSGRITVTDLSQNPPNVKFFGGGSLTPEGLNRLDSRIIALGTTIHLLERTDPSAAGIKNILATEVGGIMIQIPVIRSIVSALGLTEDEIADIQVKRGEFFAVLTPLARSFSSGGSRANSGQPAEIALAARILNMTKWSSTVGGASETKNNLIDLLTDMRNRLQAQRLTRSSSPPIIHEPIWTEDEQGNITGKLGG